MTTEEQDVKNIIAKISNIKIDKIKFMGEGYDSKAYLINEEYIFKIAKHDDSRACYRREKRILDFLSENLKTSIKIPQITYFDSSGIMGYKLIKGTPITEYIYNKMSSSQRKKLVEDIVTFLKSLHQLDYSSIAEYQTDLKKSYIDDLKLLEEKVFPILSDKEREYIVKLIKDIIDNESLFNVPKSLCHNDFNLNHVLVDENFKLVGVIDFGDSTIIETYRDFAYFLSNTEEGVDPQFGLSILDTYDYEFRKLAINYSHIYEAYYPIETIVCGLENEDDKLFKKGMTLLSEYVN